MELPSQIKNGLLLCSLFTILSGCATESFDAAKAPEFLVQSDYAPFYKLGPGQGRGPDASLHRGQRLKMLRREFGYSYVEIPDGRMGYIANEEISPAPASEPVRSASPARKRSAGNPLATGNDASAALDSLSEIEVLPEPVDVLHPISEMDSSADSKPEFRY
jgi:hypothetical protein